MSTTNQQNKAAVWDYWQKLNHVPNDQTADVVRAACHPDVDWNGSAPIDRLVGVDALIADFWEPLLRSFPDLKRTPDIFMGGIDDGQSGFASDGGAEWVTGCGHLSGTFTRDWLGIPASGKKTHMYFGQFYLMREGNTRGTIVMLWETEDTLQSGEATPGLSEQMTRLRPLLGQHPAYTTCEVGYADHPLN